MKLPVVLIHGLYGFGDDDKLNTDNILPYWGRGGRNVVKHLQGKGYTVYYPSLGPFNSAWDRACILWAYLYGGTVDFGKAHSENHGHARYGATYPGVLKKGQKIDLFGHSFGGATVKEVSHLWTVGDKDERNSGECSELFCGGHGDWLHTVTTLSGVNNGTTAATLTNNTGLSLATIFAVMMADKMNETLGLKQYYNFNLEQWGSSPFSKFIAYAKNDVDNIAGEMAVDTVQKKVNPYQKVNANTYYFAQRAYKTFGIRTQTPWMMSVYCAAFGTIIGQAAPLSLVQYGVGKDVDWFRNDGYVNLTGCSAPLNQKHKDADWGTSFKPGIWYDMPPVFQDHMFWNGMTGSKDEVFRIWDKMLDTYNNL